MSDMPINILLVEDNPGDARLFQVLAQAADLPFEIMHRGTLHEGLDAVAECVAELILLDLNLPDATGLEAVRQMRHAAPHSPLIVLTGLDDETLAIESLKQGAQDYLVKGNIGSNSLRRALRYALERQRVQLEINNLSLVDDLTGLYNRRGFMAIGENRLKLARRNGEPFLVVFLDLDGLKPVNDLFGHSEGNHALVETANILRDSFRQSDVLARLGGDEFAAFVTDAGPESIQTVKDRVQRKLDACNAERDRQYNLSFSIGIVAHDSAGAYDLETLLAVADALMYDEKRSKQTRTAATLGL